MFLGVDSAGMPVISCVFAPSLDTPAHIELAERLGYRRAWCYDSPAAYADPWMVLAPAAGRTRAIGLGPASLDNGPDAAGTELRAGEGWRHGAAAC